MKAALLASVFVGATATSALAVDLRIKTQLGQTLEVNDNRDLRPKPLGVTYAPVSSLNFDVLARTPTMRFAATTNLSYRSYFGEGAGNAMNALDKDANARISKTTKLTTYDVGASWSERDAGNVQLEDVGFRTVRGTITTYTLDGGFKHQFGPKDSFALSARGTSVTFTAPTQTPYDDFSTTASWTHRASRTLDLIGLASYYFKDSATSDVTIWKTTAGFDARLSSRLTVRGTAGVNIVQTSSESGAIPASPTLSSGSAAGWVADLFLAYRLRQTTRLGLSIAHSVSPDALGDIQERDTINASLTEEINRRSSLTFTSGISRNSGSGSSSSGNSGASDVFNASAAYAYRLTPELNSNIAYRFTYRDGSGGTARSNSILLSVRRDITLLP